jgi:hypothetical protein
MIDTMTSQNIVLFFWDTLCNFISDYGFMKKPKYVALLDNTRYCMLIVTNKMQRNTIFFIVIKALHVSGGFPTHYQELKNCTCSIWYLLSMYSF